MKRKSNNDDMKLYIYIYIYIILNAQNNTTFYCGWSSYPPVPNSFFYIVLWKSFWTLTLTALQHRSCDLAGPKALSLDGLGSHWRQERVFLPGSGGLLGQAFFPFFEALGCCCAGTFSRALLLQFWVAAAPSYQKLFPTLPPCTPTLRSLAVECCQYDIYLWLAPGVDDGQGGLEYCSPWDCRVGHDWATELNWAFSGILEGVFQPFPQIFKNIKI